jgi:hypothetical protein
MEQFELLVRSYLDRIIDRDVLHNFALAHIDDEYLPEFQRPLEDLHLLFLPDLRSDSETFPERQHIRYLLDLLEELRKEIAEKGLDAIRLRELTRMAKEPESKVENRARHREQYRKPPDVRE